MNVGRKGRDGGRLGGKERERKRDKRWDGVKEKGRRREAKGRLHPFNASQTHIQEDAFNYHGEGKSCVFLPRAPADGRRGGGRERRGRRRRRRRQGQGND